MPLDRRELLGALGGLAAARILDPARLAGAAPPQEPAAFPAPGAAFPRRADFALADGLTYLNAAYTHPVPRVAMQAAQAAAARRAGVQPAPAADAQPSPRALFAQLVGATPSEIAYVSSTSEAENLVVRALGLDHRRDGNVVTDGLHFEGALMHLEVLRQRGLEVRVVRPTADARVRLEDLDAAMDARTRLVEVTATAMYNGFQHDLAAIARLAHARGALVYADIVHAAGAEPLDLPATGVDFAACSSFKWLMGDFGLGFLYVREAVLDRLERPVVGYYQAPDLAQDLPPRWSAPTPVHFTPERTAAGHFEMGALTGSVGTGVALLSASLRYVLALGVDRIQAHRQPLLARLRAEVPPLGFTCVTPPGSTGALLTFTRPGLAASDLPRRLAAAQVHVRIADDWMRCSPSVYNDESDVQRLVAALR